jgi:hypothetical protein
MFSFVFFVAFPPSEDLAGTLEAVEAGALPAVDAGLGAIAEIREDKGKRREVVVVWGEFEVWPIRIRVPYI